MMVTKTQRSGERGARRGIPPTPISTRGGNRGYLPRITEELVAVTSDRQASCQNTLSGSASFSCKGQGANSLCGPHSLCHNYSA